MELVTNDYLEESDMRILHVDSSITGQNSISRALSLAIVERLLAGNAAATVVRRDLAADPLPYYDAQRIAEGVQEAPSEGDGEPAHLGASVVEEFMSADVIVVGTPMYNFGIPAQLKTWIDYLAVAGVTFTYTATGPEGLAGGRRVILASARGGIYVEGTPQAAVEHQESYLKAVFNFFGIEEVEVIRAEGVRMGPDAQSAAMVRAAEAIAELDA